MKGWKTAVLSLFLVSCLLACSSGEESEPNDTQGYLDRGLAAAQKGELDRAITDFNLALKLNPDKVTAYKIFYNRGVAYKEKGDLDQAIADYSQALRLKKFSLGFINRGAAFELKGDLDRALDDYNRALEFNSKLADKAYFNRGTIYKKKGELERAIEDYTRAIELNPKFAWAYNNRGVAYFKKMDMDRALVDYKRSLEIDPNWAPAHYNKAELLEKVGKPMESLEAYQTFLKYAPPEEKDRIQRAQERIKSLGKEINHRKVQPY
jgi:tetratricopeptide (TPR) repeat protein